MQMILFFMLNQSLHHLCQFVLYMIIQQQMETQYRLRSAQQGASACSTCDLVKSRDSISDGRTKQPNTLSSACSDDGPASAQYLQTESIERIEIKNLSGSGAFQPGQPGRSFSSCLL
jgi:hypothetical protein